MLRRSLRGLMIAATVSIAALAATQPVLAEIELSHTGTVGAHSLTDTPSHPAAFGKYRWYDSDNLGWLKRFYVNAPKMKAVAGKTSQVVGWLFIVERKDCGFFGCNPWHVTYTSPETTAITDDSHSPGWGQASVDVHVPCGHNCEDLASSYRITEKLIWHRPNGSTQGTVRYRIYWYGAQATNGTSGVQKKTAGAAWSPDF